MTQCKAYMGIEPHFDLWNYLFHARLRPGSDMDAVVWGNVDIFVWSRSGVNPYFRFPMSDPLVGWQKVWFFLRNDTDVLPPYSLVSTPSLNLNGGMVCLSDTSAGYNPYVTLSGSCYNVS
jgi:hypothetical protein